MHRKAVTVAASCLLLAAEAAQALGLGRSVTATQLGQPLNFAAIVKLADDEALARECVAADVMSGDHKLAPGQIVVTLEPGSHPGERSLRVTSSTLIDEPVVTVNVTVGCAMKVSRSYVAFIDPPVGSNLAQAPDPKDLPAQHADSQVAPLVDIVRGIPAVPASAPHVAAVAAASDSALAATPAPAAAPRPRAGRTERRVASNTASSTASNTSASRAQAAPAQRTRRVARANPAPQVARRTPPPPAAKAAPRLQLDPPEVLVARAPDDAASQAAAAASAALARAEAIQAQAEQERERLAQVERQLASLRSDAKAMRDTLAALQTRLAEAQSDRYANPLVYALAALAAVLGFAVALLWWRETRRPPAKWWAAPEAERPPVTVAPAAAAVAAAAPLPEPAVERTDAHIAPVPPSARVPALAPVLTAVAAGPAPDQPTTIASDSHDLSVDELIDLDQQAEFFIVLGQDDAAIDLLMSHVRGAGSIGPLPHLKLLEIYRRRGDDDAYERIRERFNRRFGARAPAWEADLPNGQSLEDYPETIERLQRHWGVPAEVMPVIEAALFRRQPGEPTFDLPAYGELLFLYTVARDLLDPRGAGAIDLLLPLEFEEDEHMARGTVAAFSLSTLPVDIDVSSAARPPLTVQELDSRSAFIEFTDMPLRSTGTGFF
jgi:hypothetical protein